MMGIEDLIGDRVVCDGFEPRQIGGGVWNSLVFFGNFINPVTRKYVWNIYPIFVMELSVENDEIVRIKLNTRYLDRLEGIKRFKFNI